ncbi:MAG: winged helix DNA-binding protein [Novosphingobium sp.]|nr:winged helix DNA-binding protein [Novosphingobium sp.]
MSSPTEFRRDGGQRSSVRSGDPPGLVSSLRTLARAMLALTDGNEAHTGMNGHGAGDRRQWGKLASNIYHERTRRADFFPAELFGEPSWDILLDLFHAAKASELRSIKSVCLSSRVPEATALRYIDQLAAHGLVERRPDKTDARRKFLSLTPIGMRGMQDYLSSMPPLGDTGEDLIRYLVMDG